jgi:hypothetical protein
MKVRERRFHTGWVISVEDEFSQGAYLIDSGDVDIMHMHRGGRHVLSTFGP